MLSKFDDALLGVQRAARGISDDALVLYYQRLPRARDLERFEVDLERLERRIAGMRLIVQAARSRGEDPMGGR